MFKERKTKFALLSLLSALVVASTAFVGVSIYAQTDDSELTTFEEEAIAAGEQFEDSAGNATSDDNATEDGSTSTADVSSLLDGLVVCNVANAEISSETQAASSGNSSGATPTVSVTVMSETEVAALADNETSTASETSTAAADCVMVGGDGEASDDANATSTASDATPDNATSMGNMTGADNATDTAMSGLADASNETSAASASGSDEEILVIEGQDFAPGEVVLMFSGNSLVGIDDVDPAGEIEAKIPVPDSGETAVAGNDTSGTELRFLESGTLRSASFQFDGETLTASEDGDIEAEGGEDGGATTTLPAPAPSDNSTSRNSTSTNSTNATMQ